MKKFISLLLTAVMLLVFAGCDGDYEYQLTESGNFNFDSSNTGIFSSDFLSSDASSDISVESAFSTSASSYSQTSYPTFYSLNDLRDYLNSQKDNNKFEISFYYKGSESFEAQAIAQMTSSLFVNYNYSGNFYTVTLSEYPGDHIVDAYFSGDKSSLTSDEKKAMEKAIQMVTTAKSKAETSWQLELLIHDMLAEHITYYDDTRDFETPDNAPRNLTIIGALLDGKANCQGYSDAFYTLASIAGFKVSRMNVETKDDLHVINTILLGGNWYIVDVTFDDQSAGNPINYRLFNAGMDQVNEYTWKSWKEIHKIASISGNDFYYKRNNIVFYSASNLAEYVKEEWLNGNNKIVGALKNESEVNALKAPLDKFLGQTGKAYSYKYWVYDDGKDLYYTVEFY